MHRLHKMETSIVLHLVNAKRQVANSKLPTAILGGQRGRLSHEEFAKVNLSNVQVKLGSDLQAILFYLKLK